VFGGLQRRTVEISPSFVQHGLSSLDHVEVRLKNPGAKESGINYMDLPEPGFVNAV